MPGGYPYIPDTCNGTDIGNSPATSSLGTTITASSTINTKGSWTQLIASTAADATWMVVQLKRGANTSVCLAVDIAIGASGSEQTIATNLTAGLTGISINPNVVVYSFPVTIPAGTRIAARCQADVASDTVYVTILLLDGSLLGMEGAGIDDIGFNAAASKGTTVNASSTINTKGSYSQLVASTTRDYVGLLISIDPGTNYGLVGNQLYDLAIGASGSEIVIIPNILSPKTANGNALGPTPFGPIPLQIPAGTRLAARAQSDTVSTYTGITVYGIYG
jgi:hypothetical protein